MNLSSCSNLTSTYNFTVLIPFIGKTLILLYTIIIYLQEKIILYAKMHNKKHCLYSELQNTSSVEFQLIFDWNLMLIFYV